MLNTVHVAAAAAIVRLVPDPAVAIPLALASHIVLDTVPHWNWHPGGTFSRVAGSVADIGVAAGVSALLATHSVHPWVTLAACFSSTVPDLIQGPYYFWGFRPPWLQAFIGWESRRQKWPWCPMWLGVATQAATFVASLVIVFR